MSTMSFCPYLQLCCLFLWSVALLTEATWLALQLCHVFYLLSACVVGLIRITMIISYFASSVLTIEKQMKKYTDQSHNCAHRETDYFTTMIYLHYRSLVILVSQQFYVFLYCLRILARHVGSVVLVLVCTLMA